MKSFLLLSVFLLSVFVLHPVLSDNLDDYENDLFCALINHRTESYIDLSQLTPTPNKRKSPIDVGNGRDKSSLPISSKTKWLVKGWYYDDPHNYRNFTLSVCSSAISTKQEQEPGFPLTRKTGAYFFDNSTKEYVSIGEFNTKPILLGDRNIVNRKISLRYENGSMCPNGKERRSTLINFICDREVQTAAQINFLGSLHDCAYMFEVRSLQACPTSNQVNDVNVKRIFFGIFFVFFLVELARRQMLKMINTNDSFRSYNDNNTGNNSRFSGYGRDSNQTRWEIIESEPKWKMAIKFLVNKASEVPTFIINNLSRENISSKYHSSTGAYSRLSNGFANFKNNDGTIRLNNPNTSDDSFLRDMEVQNNILDNLDNYNTNSPSPSVRINMETDSTNNPLDDNTNGNI